MVVDKFLWVYMNWNCTDLKVPHIGCVIFNNLLSVSEPQVLHLGNEDPTSKGCMTYKVLGTYPCII